MSSTTSRKARALAAGGAVLGLGAVVTLAAWSDSEFAQGSFAAGAFGIQAAVDGENFTEHSDRAGALSLNAEARELTPGETVTYPYQISLIEDSEDATVTYVDDPSYKAGELMDSLEIDVLQVATTDESCEDVEVSHELEPGESFELKADHREQALCIQVTLDPDFQELESEKGAQIVWEFHAEEPEPTTQA